MIVNDLLWAGCFLFAGVTEAFLSRILTGVDVAVKVAMSQPGLLLDLPLCLVYIRLLACLCMVRLVRMPKVVAMLRTC
jgi:hypothetical protein